MRLKTRLKRKMLAVKARGGKLAIGRMLGRGCTFAEIDAARAEIERDDRARERRKCGAQ